MKSVILDSFENENPIGNTLKKVFEQKGEELSFFKLKDMNIKPCRSCGACGFKSPGKCVINDDIHPIMRAIANGDILIMLTPIRFGGYSSQLKKAVDRTMPIGFPLYCVKQGHLLHSMRYGHKYLLGIGLAEQNLTGEEENFKALVANNGLNMQFTHETLIFKPSDDAAKIEQEICNFIESINQEVKQV